MWSLSYYGVRMRKPKYELLLAWWRPRVKVTRLDVKVAYVKDAFTKCLAECDAHCGAVDVVAD